MLPFRSEGERVAIIQRCLEDDVLPILMFDLPKPRSDRQRASWRCAMNLVSGLIEGNLKWMQENGMDYPDRLFALRKSKAKDLYPKFKSKIKKEAGRKNVKP